MYWEGVSLPLLAFVVVSSSCLCVVMGYRNASVKWYIFAGLMWAFVLGSLYAGVWDKLSRIQIAEGSHVCEGMVDSYPVYSDGSQSFVLDSSECGRVYVRTDRVHVYAYHDLLTAEGNVGALDKSSSYLIPQRVSGVFLFPSISAQGRVENFSVRGSLYRIREQSARTLESLLPRDEASLAVGMLLGKESAFFSREFKGAMRVSGTTHLVALSGYNIAVVSVLIYMLCSLLFPRRMAAWGALGGIFLFVIMTGAEASVVRAACMGSLLIASRELGRVYSFKQSVALVAFGMVMLNPAAVRFDMGFILSFLSLFGVIYVAPCIYSFFDRRLKKESSLLKIFAQTLGAQLMTAPMLVMMSGQLSLWGVITNILILPLVPFIMAGGFLVILCGLMLPSLGFLLSLPLHRVLQFVYEVIMHGGNLPYFIISFPFVWAIVYYGLVGWWMYRVRTRAKLFNETSFLFS